jgi:hypothetical protein
MGAADDPVPVRPVVPDVGAIRDRPLMDHDFRGSGARKNLLPDEPMVPDHVARQGVDPLFEILKINGPEHDRILSRRPAGVASFDRFGSIVPLPGGTQLGVAVINIKLVKESLKKKCKDVLSDAY